MSDLLRVNDLEVEISTRAGSVRALDGLSLRVRPGSTVALVGESGSGKSVAAQAILGILPRNGRMRRTVERLRAMPSRSISNSLRCVWFVPE